MCVINPVILEVSFGLPTVDLLDALVPGVLAQKGNLLKAVRLWVILRSLYGDLEVELLTGPDGWFSNAQWRESFFASNASSTPDHSLQDYRTKPLHQWLFGDFPDLDEEEWKQTFAKRYEIDRQNLNLLLGDTKASSKAVKQICPFLVDERTLRNDFVTLARLGWLEAIGERNDRRYRKVSQLPDLGTTVKSELTAAHFIPNDLSNVVDHFPQPINGIQRFILDVEYIIPQHLSSSVEEALQLLKTLWSYTPVPPIRLTYRSIRYFQEEFELIVYPVCIYYFQRAPYLFAFGQTPKQMKERQEHAAAERSYLNWNWYDYRLDRILRLQPLSWEHPEVAKQSIQKSDRLDDLPRWVAEKTPAFVQQEVTAALGVEIYRPIVPLLLRFDRYFYGNYIANTERATLFTQLEFKQAEKRFQADPVVYAARLSLQALFDDRPRHKSDVFCLTQCRDGDNNVVMRLRAWGPNVEVLLPMSLRQRMMDEVKETWRLYQADPYQINE